MAKLQIIIGVLFFILGIPALPRDFNITNSPSAHALGSGRYRGSASFRNAANLNDEGVKTRRNNSTVKFFRHRNTPHSPILEHMRGKAIFFSNPDEKPAQDIRSNFERKTGHSLKINEKTINDTIREVEEIIKANPQLPRLSRQEVIDILNNLTNSNSLNLTESNSKTSPGQSREDYIRSLMLVMPFNTNNLSESMIQDLYTKPPITEIINTTPSTPPTTYEWKIVVGEISKEPKEVFSKGTNVTLTTEPTAKFTQKTAEITTQKPYSSSFSYTIPRFPDKLKNKQPTYGERQRPRIGITTTQKPTTIIQEPENTVPRFRVKTTQKPTTIYQYPESTLSRLRAKTTKAPFIVTATSVTPKPFKRIPAHVTIPSTLKKDNILIREDVKELLASIGLFPLDQPGSQNESTKTSKDYTVTTTPAPFPMDAKKGADTLSPEMQNLLKSFGLLDNEIPSAKDSGTKQVTTQSPFFDPPPPEPTVDIRSYSAFKPLPIQDSVPNIPSNKATEKMGHDMKEFLASFGLLQDEENIAGTVQVTGAERVQKSRKPHSFLRERKYDEIKYNLTNSSQEKDENEKTTNKTSVLDLSIDTDMLPDEMKDVLQTLGLTPKSKIQTKLNKTTSIDLLSSLNTTKTTTQTTTSVETTTTDSVRTTNRIDSDIITEIEPENITEDTIPPTTTQTTLEDEENVSTEGHIFNPTDTVHNTEDIEHLNKLLKTVRLLANGTSPEELETFLGENSKELFQSDEGKHRKEKMTSLDQAKNPPDPLSFEEMVYILNAAKNEVKRQQPQANVSISDNTTDATEVTTSSSTIEASESSERNPSVEDLAASFGGSDDEEEDSELPAPPSRPNGLYFLLDWNSFLEVGEDNSRVNLRFAPKLGDSRNFLPVTVP